MYYQCLKKLTNNPISKAISECACGYYSDVQTRCCLGKTTAFTFHLTNCTDAYGACFCQQLNFDDLPSPQ